MPAPDLAILKTNIKLRLIAAGVTQKAYDNDGSIIDTGAVPASLENITDAIAEGIIDTWTIWQAAQTVASPVQVVPATGTGSTIPTPGSLP